MGCPRVAIGSYYGSHSPNLWPDRHCAFFLLFYSAYILFALQVRSEHPWKYSCLLRRRNPGRGLVNGALAG